MKEIKFKFIKMEREDVPFLVNIRNGYAEKFLHNSNTFTVPEAFEWFEKINPNYWIIYLENTPIGYFRLTNYNEENKNIMIGADIDPSYTGLGYGYKSYKEFIPFVFKHFGVHKIQLEVLATNIIAIRLYKKLGFIQEGIKREDVLKGDEWIDSIIMSILKNEYNEN